MELVSAFSDTHDITVRLARDIKPLAGDAKSLAKMRAEAEKISAERAETGARLGGPAVAKRLVKATVQPTVKIAAEKDLTGTGGKVILRYARTRGGGLTIKVQPKSSATRAELMNAIEGLLDQS